jgi:hypothetical protein
MHNSRSCLSVRGNREAERSEAVQNELSFDTSQLNDNWLTGRCWTFACWFIVSQPAAQSGHEQLSSSFGSRAVQHEAGQLGCESDEHAPVLLAHQHQRNVHQVRALNSRTPFNWKHHGACSLHAFTCNEPSRAELYPRSLLPPLLLAHSLTTALCSVLLYVFVR